MDVLQLYNIGSFCVQTKTPAAETNRSWTNVCLVIKTSYNRYLYKKRQGCLAFMKKKK